MRDYAPLIAAARASGPLTREQAMDRTVALLWQAFGHNPISWVGFYLRNPENTEEMVLVCREPKPACSPIGLHGMCGKGMLTKRSIIISDVRTLGENYIACDPKDQSEVVIPLIDGDGNCDAVLDVDSYDLNAFDDGDERGMTGLLGALRLTTASCEPRAK